jgi:hypothetical protein
MVIALINVILLWDIRSSAEAVFNPDVAMDKHAARLTAR